MSICENFSWVGEGWGWSMGHTGRTKPPQRPLSGGQGGRRGAVPGGSSPAPRGGPRGPTWSPQSQIMLYIICVTQKQCRKLWKGLFL